MARHPPPLLSEPIELFFSIDTLWFECQREAPRDGEEAHETLFGEGALHPKLEAANAARELITKKLRGPVRTIADFAVTSGHEALTVFAGRLASFTSIGRRHIPEAEAALRDEIAGRTNTEKRPLGIHDVQLHDVQVAFAKSVSAALKGWWEHRAWIHRSIVEELHDAGSTNLPAKDRSSAPRILKDSLPWRILSVLTEAGGTLKRITVLDRVSDQFDQKQRKSKRQQISNLLAPSGQLVAAELVRVAGEIVTILPPGSEAIRE